MPRRDPDFPRLEGFHIPLNARRKQALADAAMMRGMSLGAYVIDLVQSRADELHDLFEEDRTETKRAEGMASG